MKKWIAALLIATLVVPVVAEARPGGGHHSVHGYWRGGYYSGWGWRGDWVAPALFGGVLLYGLSQPTVVVQPSVLSTPTTIVAPQVQSWYWCADANAYYPYVQTCPTGWQAVPAMPPAPGR